jgi:hypothetical protein
MGKRDQESMLADAILAYPREAPFVSTDVQRETVRRIRLLAFGSWCVLTLIAMMVPTAILSTIESVGQARGVVIVACEVLIVAGIGGGTTWHMHRLAVHKTIRAHPLIRTNEVVEVDIGGQNDGL